MKSLKLFFTLLFCQSIGYILWIINVRAVSQAQVPVTLISDGIYASLQYFIFKKLIEEGKETRIVGFLGYVLGSELGSYLGLIVSQYLLGK